MTERDIEGLKKMGCEFEYNPIFLADEGYFDCLYSISYKGIYVGSERCTLEFIKEQVDRIDSVFEDGVDYGARMS